MQRDASHARGIVAAWIPPADRNTRGVADRPAGGIARGSGLLGTIGCGDGNDPAKVTRPHGGCSTKAHSAPPNRRRTVLWHSWPDLRYAQLSATQAAHLRGQAHAALADGDMALQVQHAPTLASRAIAAQLMLATAMHRGSSLLEDNAGTSSRGEPTYPRLGESSCLTYCGPKYARLRKPRDLHH
jgi:hypothetical protein